MNDGSDPLTQRYKEICQQINQLSDKFGQPPPCLLAVSKKQTSEAIRQLYQLGQRHFGESYWQETEQKLNELGDLDIQWHFIGPLQSNKTRPIAEHMHWVHSVDREKIARRLSQQRPHQLPPLNVCLQVNLDGETSKSGVSPSQVLPLAKQVAAMSRLNLRGLMCIPKRHTDFQQQRHCFMQMTDLKSQLISAGLHIDTLSMGMSNDMEAAIAEGSTILRIGTALFSERQKNVTNP